MEVKEEAFTCWICKGEGHKAGSRACPMFLSETVKRERLRWSFEDPMHNFMKEEEKKDKEKRVQELQSLLESSSSSDERKLRKNKRKKKKRHKDVKKKRYDGKRKQSSSDSDSEICDQRSRKTLKTEKYCDIKKMDQSRTKHRLKSEDTRKEHRTKSGFSENSHHKGQESNQSDNNNHKRSRSKYSSDTVDDDEANQRGRKDRGEISSKERSDSRIKHGQEKHDNYDSRRNLLKSNF